MQAPIHIQAKSRYYKKFVNILDPANYFAIAAPPVVIAIRGMGKYNLVGTYHYLSSNSAWLAG